MKADDRFIGQPLEFWANVKLISQKVGYTEQGTSKVKIPSIKEIIKVYTKLKLSYFKIIDKNKNLTTQGALLIDYFKFRAEFLNDNVEGNLMKLDQAKALFDELSGKLNPKCPTPFNKQKGDKKAPAYFTAIINMLIESHSYGYECNYDPRELPAFTNDGFPVRSLSRRVDGAFPSVINPIALWEIKEYYYTTTFGSRIADAVYESLLDGFELAEIRQFLDKTIHHYLMVDDYNTWWNMGRSYLCRICDILHMGLITEVLFGKEVIDRIPILVKEWKAQHDISQKSVSGSVSNEERQIKIALENR
jgi:hypothetical protein